MIGHFTFQHYRELEGHSFDVSSVIQPLWEQVNSLDHYLQNEFPSHICHMACINSSPASFIILRANHDEINADHSNQAAKVHNILPSGFHIIFVFDGY